MNNTILVGRIASGPNVVELDEGKKCTTLTLAVHRNFKNAEYCHVGDIIGVKGRIQSSNYEDENGKKHYVTEVIGDKVTFLSSEKDKQKIENFVKSYIEKTQNENKEIKPNEISDNNEPSEISENKKKSKNKQQERDEIN